MEQCLTLLYVDVSAHRAPSARRAGLVLIWTAGAVFVTLSAVLWPVARPLVRSVATVPMQWWRATTGPHLEPFGRLAASQLGYLPRGPKAFTSPRPFATFSVIDAAQGVTVWRAKTPPAALTTGLLAATTSVWIGDFTAFTTPGRYRVVADNGLESHPFTIDADVYAAAIRAVQRTFYFQRAFTALESRFAEGPWIHDSDAALAPPGVGKGWHDAGDYSLYNMTAASSLFWLLQAWADFAPLADDTNIPESGNGIPDLLDEVRWELEWLLSTATPSGAFRNSTCLERYAAYGQNTPERAAPYVHGEPGTIATARAVGVLATAAGVFAPIDAAFAGTLRQAAARGWDWLAARPDEHSDGPTCDAYRQDGDVAAGRAVRMFAAAGMLGLTGEARFRDAFEVWFDDIDQDPSAYRFNAYAALLYLRAGAVDPARQAAIRARLRAHADATIADAAAHPFAWAGRYVWGSIGIGFERSGGFTARQCVDEPRAGSPYCRQALANVDYLFGRNLYQFAYVSAVPGTSRSRGHAFHHWLASARFTPFLFPGAVAGGPNDVPEPLDGSRPLARRPVWGYWDDPAMPRDATTATDGRFTDNDSWSTNELAIGWQAVTLYNLYFARWAGQALGDDAK